MVWCFEPFSFLFEMIGVEGSFECLYPGRLLAILAGTGLVDATACDDHL
jgi:hypothetical protein